VYRPNLEIDSINACFTNTGKYYKLTKVLWEIGRVFSRSVECTNVIAGFDICKRWKKYFKNYFN